MAFPLAPGNSSKLDRQSCGSLLHREKIKCAAQ